MSDTTPFDDLRVGMERRRLMACAHTLHIYQQGVRWGVAIEPDTGDVYGGYCEKSSVEDQPGDTLGADWRDHWRRRHDTTRKLPEGDSDE